MIKRYCTICGRIHEGRCVRPQVEKRDSKADRFRNTQVWRKKARAIMRRDYHCCRVCAERGRIETRGLSVHHITPLADDFDKRLDDDNLITLCREHHEEAERGGIRAKDLRDLAMAEFFPRLR